jgi:hypothetical protein
MMENKMMKHPALEVTGCFINEAYFINMILRVVVKSSAAILTK